MMSVGGVKGVYPPWFRDPCSRQHAIKCSAPQWTPGLTLITRDKFVTYSRIRNIPYVVFKICNLYTRVDGH